MRPFARPLQRLFALTLGCLSLLPLGAQSYQTSFSEVKYDRGNPPAIFHGGLEVEPLSGSASLKIPLGPGIGARGVQYVPTVRITYSPQYSFSRHNGVEAFYKQRLYSSGWAYYPKSASFDPAPDYCNEGVVPNYYVPPPKGSTVQFSPFHSSMIPGRVQLMIHPHPEEINHASVHTYDLPSGESGVLKPANQLPTGIEVESLLKDFGYQGYLLTREPGVVATEMYSYFPMPSASQKASYLAQFRTHDFIRLTSGGGILLGLKGNGKVDFILQNIATTGYISPSDTPKERLIHENIAIPSILLLIKDDIAYEFEYGNRFQQKLVYKAINTEAQSEEDWPVSAENRPTHAGYWLTRIKNRVGDELRFDYGLNANGTPLPAPLSEALFRRPFGGDSSDPGEVFTARWYRKGIFTGVLIRQSKDKILYEGVNCSNYSITPGECSVDNTIYTPDVDYPERSYLGGNGCIITQDATGDSIYFKAPGGVPQEIQFPNKNIKIEWDKYKYVRGIVDNPEFHWNGFYPDRGTYVALGVVKISETDPVVLNQERVTTYQRRVPSLKLIYDACVTNLTQDTPFIGTYDTSVSWISTRCDAAVTHPDGTSTYYKFFEPPASTQVPLTAPLADQLQAMAYLKHLPKEEGRYAAGAFDWNNPDASIPFQKVTRSELDLRALFNPNGEPALSSQPYARTTVTEEPSSGVTIREHLENWDPTHYGWKLQQKTATGKGVTLVRDIQRTWEYLPSRMIGPRITWEKHPGKAAVTRTFDEQNRVVTELYNKTSNNNLVNPDLKLTYTYNTLTQAQPDEIAVSSSQALNLADVAGASYTYDQFGFLKTIQPKGVSWYLEQTNDGFGRAVAQYDANRLKTTIQWGTDGRLASVTPPSETGTTYAYDSDGRGVTIQRGAGGPKAQLRYNGFGEPILERRWNASANASHRLWGHNTKGQKTWETTWVSGAGNETAWTSVSPETVIPGWQATECIRYRSTPYGMECVEYSTTTVPDQHIPIACTRFGYDTRGRVIQTIDPNNLGVSTAYDDVNLKKTVTTGLFWNGTALTNRGSSATTVFQQDALGRLVGVTDALNQPTTYSYDDADRILSVIQKDPANLTRVQTRTWAYNTLGWLLSLTQPESGTTSYSAFDVSGKAWTTSYNGRILNATFDALGRMRSLKSVAPDDPSVDQSFDWDTAPTNGKGKLAKATANGVIRELNYDGLGGRLGTLTRTVDGLPPFTQRFSYSTYGTLSSRTYPDGKVQTFTLDAALGLPTASTFNGASVMSLAGYDATHWGLTTLSLVNGVTSRFTYGNDQTRLATLQQEVVGKLKRTWSYGYDDQSRLLTAVGSDATNAVGFLQDEERYTYDALGRLKTALVRDPWGSATQGLFQQFDYDPFGNRKLGTTGTVPSWPANAPPATFTPISTLRSGLDKVVANVTFNATDPAFLKNQLPGNTSAAAATGAVYDTQGNLTQVFPRPGVSGEPVNLAYDALGRVTSLSYGPNATRKTETYLYDDEGLRIRVWDGAKYRYNLYNEARQLVAQYEKIGTGSLTWKKNILYVGTKEVAEIGTDGKTSVTMCDHLGSPRFAYDGVTLSQQKFLPYGESLADALTAGKFAKGFTNHENTDASGLIYMQARYYLPMYGRFANTDPALDQHFDDTQSWNIYSYVMNNPVMGTDPTGMWPDWGAIYDKVLDGAADLHVGLQQVPIVGYAYGAGVKLGEAIGGSRVEAGGHVVELSIQERQAVGVQGGKEMLPLLVGGATQATFMRAGGLSLPTPGPSLTTPEGVVISTTSTVVVSTTATGNAIGALTAVAMTGGRGDQYEHKSGRNEPHRNPDARNSARTKLNEKQTELDKAKKANDMSKEGRRHLKDLEQQIKHLRKKMDDTGDTHGRRGK